MDFYIVVLNDRHTELELFIYKRRDKALGKARKIVAVCGYEVPEGDGEFEESDDFLFYAPLSSEGDDVTVRKVLLKD